MILCPCDTWVASHSMVIGNRGRYKTYNENEKEWIKKGMEEGIYKWMEEEIWKWMGEEIKKGMAYRMEKKIKKEKVGNGERDKEGKDNGWEWKKG